MPESEYVITGRRQALQEPKLEIWVHLMDLTSDDRHNMQLDPVYIPSPALNDRLSSGFYIPITMTIAYAPDILSRYSASHESFTASISCLKTESSSLFCLTETESPSILSVYRL
jgi:hypothetical protein